MTYASKDSGKFYKTFCIPIPQHISLAPPIDSYAMCCSRRQLSQCHRADITSRPALLCQLYLLIIVRSLQHNGSSRSSLPKRRYGRKLAVPITLTVLTTSSSGSLESRFFVDDGCWRDAPILTGQTSFEPLPDVRNILVTGGEGFIASYLIRHLVTKYPSSYNIISFDKLDYCSSLNNSRLLDSFPNFRFYHGDIMSQSDVLKCLQTYKIDTIFHLAAQSHVDLSFGNSFTFTHNNVMGTHVLLESAKVTESVRRFYHISTDEVSSVQSSQNIKAKRK